MRIQRIVTVLAVALLGACASFELTGPGGDASLEFSARLADQREWLEEPVVAAEADAGGIAVAGRLSSPDPCRTVGGSLERAGSELTLRVSVRRGAAELCGQVIATFEYQAVVRNLAPGSYRLRVVHEYPETGWPTTTALDQQFQVR